jgi:putative Mn2+ efflux pump MntP
LSWIELFLIALSLSMDAFAVSIAKGLSLKKVTWKQMTWFGAWFGIFQGLMPFLGYCFAQLASGWLEQFDHWIAFILLSMIGGKMIWDSFHEEESIDPEIGWKSMLVLAIATSIDALAVGVSFAFMSVSILPAVTLIGAVTFGDWHEDRQLVWRQISFEGNPMRRHRACFDRFKNLDRRNCLDPR